MKLEKMEHHQALQKAKITLMGKKDSAFFTTILFSLKQIWDESISTLATDGRTLFMNPTFFMGLDKDLRVSALIHECMHVAYMHMTRVGTRDKEKFNIAADYVINLQLKERDFKIGEDWLLDPQYAGMSAEQVYKLLPDNPTQKCPMPDLIQPGDGESGEGKSAAAEKLNQEIQDILVRARMQSKMAGDKAGTIPGDIEIFLDRLLNPKLPWTTILRRYFQTFAKTDYSFKKPNRRFFPKYHLPSLWGESLMNLTIAVDTSGSVSDADFLRFVSEVAFVLKQMKPEQITLIQFDTDIKSVDVVKNLSELMKLKFSGRGGTNPEPVFEWADTHKPQLLLIFTDGEFRFRRDTHKGETLWVIHNNPSFSSPFGKTIHYEI